MDKFGFSPLIGEKVGINQEFTGLTREDWDLLMKIVETTEQMVEPLICHLILLENLCKQHWQATLASNIGLNADKWRNMGISCRQTRIAGKLP